MTTGEQFYDFFVNLKIDKKLPNSIEVLNPYTSEEVVRITHQFYEKYYSDKNSRILLLGINPGRYGAGITGISFTDPVVLKKNLQIQNSFQKKTELSASFIHKSIQDYGGPKLFFNSFLLSAVCPLGFTKNGVNINYYDDRELLKKMTPFIRQTLKKQIEIAGNKKVCGCIGQGKNLKFLQELNNKMNLFDKIIAFPHPRWIMQYKRKEMDKQLSVYTNKLNLLKN